MTNPLNNLKQEAQAIRLSSTEKAAMRANIFALSDASKRAQAARVKTPSPYLFIFHQRFAAIVAALLLVIFTGGGTAFAAQGALPGTALYPVKIYVNEQVQGALAISPEAKVSFHTSIAETRLKEAETLASEGRLDATTSVQIETNLNEHIAQANTIAATLTESDPAAGVEASVNLSSSLSAQGSILARLGQASSDEATKANSDALAFSVQSHDGADDSHMGGGTVVAMKAAVMAPQAQTMSLSVSAGATPPDEPASQARVMSATEATASVQSDQSTATQKKIAIQLEKKAKSEISDVQTAYAKAKSSLSATTTAKVRAQLTDLNARLDTGDAQIQDKNYIDARATFTAIIRDAVQLSAFIDASKTFNKDFVRASWGSQDSYDNGLGDVSASSSAQNTSSQTTGADSSVQITTQGSASTPTSSPAQGSTSGSKGSVNATVDTHGVHIETNI